MRSRDCKRATESHTLGNSNRQVRKSFNVGRQFRFHGQAETTFQLTFDQPGGVILPREAKIVTKK